MSDVIIVNSDVVIAIIHLSALYARSFYSYRNMVTSLGDFEAFAGAQSVCESSQCCIEFLHILVFLISLRKIDEIILFLLDKTK